MSHRKALSILFVMLFLLAASIPVKAARASTVKGSLPTIISIPKINKTAKIIPVGVTATGNLDVPHNFVQAGWYKYGTAPGEKGSTVIDGHVDNGGSIAGVFKKLHELAAGDIINVSNTAGKVLRYEVTATNVYATSAFPSEQIFADNGQALLKIITCYGTFLPKEGTYDRRLVVTAALVS